MAQNTTESLSREVGLYLKLEKATLGTAESCTAGRIAAAITSMPGSSTYFKGGIVCYTNEIKTEFLRVDAALLEKEGPVSEAVVTSMHDGALKALHTTYAIAITGYAGPGGGKEAEAGTIWIAVGSAEKVEVRKIYADGDRGQNLAFATLKSLEMLLSHLRTRVKTDK